MPPTPSLQLIVAIESGRDADVVRQLILAGADPNTHKHVTLSAKVAFPWGGHEWKTDAVVGESALALAILHSDVAIVRTLLEHGASLTDTISWKIADCGTRVWTAHEWTRERWHYTVSFHSALSLALAHGGKWTRCDRATGPCPDEAGYVAVNRRGGSVVLTHPQTQDCVRSVFTLKPNPEIINLLLAHGATLSDADITAARRSGNVEILTILESHLSSTTIPPLAAAALDLTHPTLASHFRHLTTRAEKAESRAEEAEKRVCEVERTLSSLTHTITLLQSRLALLDLTPPPAPAPARAALRSTSDISTDAPALSSSIMDGSDGHSPQSALPLESDTAAFVLVTPPSSPVPREEVFAAA
ncbi:hypothetical protein M427DRAFT_71138 [Gonapodya prolifera JEL478]|uniref:Uncharacterized protein n=1 Tax=Gonapodya prolifera (strain JEL478) TaxID=1344416 RepID=A0A139AA70_GONPJ|nr:hypothetical protein M427DRAFT_71138 [Gonapodya prolifera JEL478]|eukprot:KXS13752.1 hypothetical protein M427DRAFT_71138 [Gonapodya prolifera JEL478]